MLRLLYTRNPKSLQYKRDPAAPFDWHNNDGVNSIDNVRLYADDDKGIEVLVFEGPVQTVANLEGLDPGVHFYDTVAPGKFFIRAFVNPRSFKCQPHGIVGAFTLQNEYILSSVNEKGIPTDDDSTTTSNKARWLLHDWKNHNDPPKDTRVAWSAGCFVHPDAVLDRLNQELQLRGVKPYDLIPVELIEAIPDGSQFFTESLWNEEALHGYQDRP